MSADKFSNQYRIASARANWHNYESGLYFVTVCTAHKEHYFGEIVDAEIRLSELGEYLKEQIIISSQIRPNMDLEIPLFVIMPNHIHLIVMIDDGRDARHCVSTGSATNQFGPQSKNLASVIRGIKIATTIFARKRNIPFEWQTRFHDHIIRNQEECNRIADYIENNVTRWDSDIHNTAKP